MRIFFLLLRLWYYYGDLDWSYWIPGENDCGCEHILSYSRPRAWKLVMG